jgi:hypothetical protein
MHFLSLDAYVRYAGSLLLSFKRSTASLLVTNTRCVHELHQAPKKKAGGKKKGGADDGGALTDTQIAKAMEMQNSALRRELGTPCAKLFLPQQLCWWITLCLRYQSAC